MEDYRGEFLNEFQHPNIIVSAEAACGAGAKWILEYFEDKIRGGAVFRPDETVQIGWVTVLLRAAQRDELEVLEPEFGSLPIQWIRGASNTIRHLIIQKEVCDQVGAEVIYPSMLQTGVISPNFLANHVEFEMSRDGPAGNDSGWVFREKGYGGMDGTLCSLYQIASSVPAVIPFLALPPGFMVERSTAMIGISAGNAKTSNVDSEFLRRLLVSAYLS